MKYYLLSAFLFFAISASGQNAVIKQLQQVNPITKEKYVFPKIFIKGNPAIAAKINGELRSQILDIDSSVADNRIFDHVWKTEDHMGSLYNLHYQVIRNAKSILSIKFSAEGCGAYCEDWDEYFTFNLKTGNALRLDRILTTKGLANLVSNFNSFKLNTLKEKVKQIQDTLKKVEIKKDITSLGYYTDMMDLYTECQEYKMDSERIASVDFSISLTSLSIYSGRCSAHYNRNLDEIGDFEFKTKLKDIEKYILKNWRTALLK